MYEIMNMLFVITWTNEAGDYMLYVHHENEDDDICATCALYEHEDEIMIEYCFMCTTQSFVTRYHNAVIRIL
jgi:hypothetical protein